MDEGSTIRFLHVGNGSATTRLIAEAGIPGSLSIWADPLYEGPVPGDVDDDGLLAVRARYLSGDSDDPVDEVNDLRLWRAAIEDHSTYDELILWYEHDLFDQLNLIQLLPWIRERVPAEKVVSLVCIGSFPGRPAFKGLGELTANELASLLPTRQRVTEAQYSSAQSAWQAFRQPTPHSLDRLRRNPVPAFPYLTTALTRFLQEYPWTTDGLSRSERRLLELASADGISLAEAFPRMQDGEDAYYMTDLTLSALSNALSRTSPSLLTLTRAGGDVGHALLAARMQRGKLSGRAALTSAGAAVLAGAQDRVQLCGVDRWLGGVHLQGQGPVWRWDPSTEEVIQR